MAYNVIVNVNDTIALNNNILSDVTNHYLSSNNYTLDKEELEMYKKQINTDNNEAYFKLRLFKIQYYQGHLYFFSFDGKD
jgi:hypothetical protein